MKNKVLQNESIWCSISVFSSSFSLWPDGQSIDKLIYIILQINTTETNLTLLKFYRLSLFFTNVFYMYTVSNKQQHLQKEVHKSFPELLFPRTWKINEGTGARIIKQIF